jgi:hypothetical protein
MYLAAGFDHAIHGLSLYIYGSVRGFCPLSFYQKYGGEKLTQEIIYGVLLVPHTLNAPPHPPNPTWVGGQGGGVGGWEVGRLAGCRKKIIRAIAWHPTKLLDPGFSQSQLVISPGNEQMFCLFKNKCDNYNKTIKSVQPRKCECYP